MNFQRNCLVIVLGACAAVGLQGCETSAQTKRELAAGASLTPDSLELLFVQDRAYMLPLDITLTRDPNGLPPHCSALARFYNLPPARIGEFNAKSVYSGRKSEFVNLIITDTRDDPEDGLFTIEVVQSKNFMSCTTPSKLKESGLAAFNYVTCRLLQKTEASDIPPRFRIVSYEDGLSGDPVSCDTINPHIIIRD